MEGSCRKNFATPRQFVAICRRKVRRNRASILDIVFSEKVNTGEIYIDVFDHEHRLAVLGESCLRLSWQVYAYYQMTNHYYLLVETVAGDCRDKVEADTDDA